MKLTKMNKMNSIISYQHLPLRQARAMLSCVHGALVSGFPRTRLPHWFSVTWSLRKYDVITSHWERLVRICHVILEIRIASCCVLGQAPFSAILPVQRIDIQDTNRVRRVPN